ncbi:Ribosomal RNA small subunit methyltransferase B [bacterium HR40]|nr:Ribosomal RNA small subunit methyltransferase B [bacterium HR40]
MNEARQIALDVLEAVFAPRPRPADEVFHRHRLLSRLAPRDRAFARLLWATTLRRLGEIDRTLDRFLQRRPKRTARNILRLAAAQLVFLGTPAHAAVAESVALARQRIPAQAGFVNAVCRRLAVALPSPLVGEEAARANTPAWLFARWSRTYGEAKALSIAAMHLREPPLDLQLRERSEEWAERLGGEWLPDGTLRRPPGGAVEELPGYAEGAFWVQDVAAALPARLLGDVRGRPVVDLCAAPGGKTAQLCTRGAQVTAVESHPARAALLRANLRRLGLTAEVVEADVRQFRPTTPATSVLLDAPCSATGTIRRHPDIPWARRPEDIPRLVTLQRQFLAAAVEMLAPGGILVYAVCSLEAEEGPEIVADALRAHPELERLPVRPQELAGLPVDLTPAGEVRTLPCHLAERGGMDGFFVARLRHRQRS